MHIFQSTVYLFSKMNISFLILICVAVLFVSNPSKLCEQGEIDDQAIISLETYNVTAVKDSKAFVDLIR